MAGKRGVGGELARDVATRFPAAPNLQLARMLRRDNPDVFLSVEQARMAVLYARGIKGDGRLNRTPHPIQRQPLPEPEPSDWREYDLPTGPARWLVLADVHVPYHSIASLEAALAWGAAKATRCTGLILLGDFLDFHQLSKFEKDPRRRNARAELDTARDLLDALRARLRLTHVVWKAGNHEYRLDRYMMRAAPELLDVATVNLPDEIGLGKRDMYVPNGMTLKRGKLFILHGDEWKGGISSPVNPARGAYLKAGECCIVGHQHRTSEHTEPTVAGTTKTCWSVGCMCDLHPAYSRQNRWNHGFAVLTPGKSSHDWRVDNYRIVNGEVV